MIYRSLAIALGVNINPPSWAAERVALTTLRWVAVRRGSAWAVRSSALRIAFIVSGPVPAEIFGEDEDVLRVQCFVDEF